MKSLAEIRALKDEVEGELLDGDGVTGVDIGYKVVNGNQTNELAIRVLVERKRDDVSGSRRIPPEIREVKTDVIERRLALVHEQTEGEPPFIARQSAFFEEEEVSYLTGGVGVVEAKTPKEAVGTLGAIVKDRTSDALMLLTCAHVLDNVKEGESVVWVKPGDVPNEVLGVFAFSRESTHPFRIILRSEEVINDLNDEKLPEVIEQKLRDVKLPLSEGVQISMLEQGKKWLLIDGAQKYTIVKGEDHTERAYQLNIFRHLPNYRRTDKLDCAVVKLDGDAYHSEIAGVGRIRGAASAARGGRVRKYGQTTKLTHGIVDTVDLTVKIDGKVLKNQIGVVVDLTKSGKFGYRGDSGAVVVNDADEIVGLYFARNREGTYGAANPIYAVLDALQVDIYEERLFGLDKDIDDSMRELTAASRIFSPGLSQPLVANLIAACRDCDDC